MTGQLIEYIKKTVLQTDIDKFELDKYFQIKTLKKNEIVLSFNSICRNYYFVNKGVLRVYFIHEGEEHTSWFAFENYFFTELESYINDTFSNYCIIAIEDCEILEISKSNIDAVFSKYKWWQEFLLFTQQQTILKLIETIKSFQTSGIVGLSRFQNFDTLIIKKFGYKEQIVTDSQREIRLAKDTMIFSHDLKLLDLKHKDGFSFIKLSINGEIYWFKQKIGPLFLGNGREFESGNDYGEIFHNHKIIKTVSVASEFCLWRIRGENSGNWITAIYYEPAIKKKKSDYSPGTSRYSKRQMRKDTKILKLESGCLD